jgi:hypothetical protein
MTRHTPQSTRTLAENLTNGDSVTVRPPVASNCFLFHMPAGCCHNEQVTITQTPTITRQIKAEQCCQNPNQLREEREKLEEGNNKKGVRRRPGKRHPNRHYWDKNGLPDKFNAKHEPAIFFI